MTMMFASPKKVDTSNLVESVVAGTNVTVDDTDPRNPIVSASGGGGGTPAWLQSGHGVPNGATVPAQIGALYEDLDGSGLYYAYGATNTDWTGLGSPTAEGLGFFGAGSVQLYNAELSAGLLAISSADNAGHAVLQFLAPDGADAGQRFNVFCYDGDPNTFVTAVQVGDICVDISTPALWQAHAADAAHWVNLTVPTVSEIISFDTHTYAQAVDPNNILTESGGILLQTDEGDSGICIFNGSPVGNLTPFSIRLLCIDTATPALWLSTGAFSNLDWVQVGSAPPPGVAVVRKFPFAYDTPDILTGAPLYTPTIDDLLLDAWIEIDTAWDGTTPLGDFGAFVTTNRGQMRDQCPSAIDMTFPSQATDTWLFNDLTSLNAATIVGTAVNALAVAGAAIVLPSGGLTNQTDGKIKFTTADPVKVVVSQDGTNTGADPGSTQGAGILYLVTVTPV